VDIVFCRTRYEYQSYTDFWRLVELSEFETVWLDELEPGRDACYIVTPRNGELPGVLARLSGQRRCKFVWWCLERPDAQGSVTRGGSIEKEIDELWLSDRWLTNLHRLRGWGPVRFVPVGSHKALGRDGNGNYVYDWTHLSYANERRLAIYDRLPGRMMPNCWPPLRDHKLAETMVMVNVHQDNWAVIEPLRFALAAAFAMPIVSEYSHDTFPYELGLDVISTQGMGFKETLGFVWHNFSMAKEYGMRTKAIMTEELTFRHCVEEAVTCLA